MLTRHSAILLFSMMMAAAASGIFFGTLNNYLFEVYDINAESRGVLEIFREMPGVLAIFILALISRIREKYIMVAAALLISISVFGLSKMPAHYYDVVALIFIWSVGAHLNLVLHSSYALALSSANNHGKLFGIVGSAKGFGFIIGTSLVWIGMGHFQLGYRDVYLYACAFSLMACIGYMFLRPKEHTANKRKKLVFRKKYTVFYILAVLFGVRKQIFLVFAPWLLVKVFLLPASKIGFLMFLAGCVGIFLKPMLGLCIDRFGERNVLVFDAIVLLFICLSYSIVPHYFSTVIAIPILYALYITDDLLFSLRNAHTTYLSKITTSRDELTSTISASFAIEHVVSMSGPVFAGILWVKYGYSWVFAICAVFAILMFITALQIPGKTSLMNMSENKE